jgi:hypothetical protein
MNRRDKWSKVAAAGANSTSGQLADREGNEPERTAMLDAMKELFERMTSRRYFARPFRPWAITCSL